MPEARKLKQKFTYSDYLSWPEDERWELIEGIPYDMSPAPSRKHQEISGNLYTFFKNYLKGKSCKVFSAPFDVRLSENNERDESIETIVQPDISIFCDPKKLDDKGAIGAPDLVVEILSPYTANKDLYEKLLIYQKYKVKEYIIVNPETEEISVHILDLTNKYDLPLRLALTDSLSVNLFPGLVIACKEIFEF